MLKKKRNNNQASSKRNILYISLKQKLQMQKLHDTQNYEKLNFKKEISRRCFFDTSSPPLDYVYIIIINYNNIRYRIKRCARFYFNFKYILSMITDTLSKV